MAEVNWTQAETIVCPDCGYVFGTRTAAQSLNLTQTIAELRPQVSPQLSAPQIYPAHGEFDLAEGRSDHHSFHQAGYAACLASEDLFVGPGSGAPPRRAQPQLPPAHRHRHQPRLCGRHRPPGDSRLGRRHPLRSLRSRMRLWIHNLHAPESRQPRRDRGVRRRLAIGRPGGSAPARFWTCCRCRVGG